MRIKNIISAMLFILLSTVNAEGQMWQWAKSENFPREY